MRLPRFRFSVRGLMVAVAIAGMGCAAIMFAWRSSQLAKTYQKRAAMHAFGVRLWRDRDEEYRFKLEWDLAAAENNRDRWRWIKEQAQSDSRHDSEATIQAAESSIHAAEAEARSLRDRQRLAARSARYHDALATKYARAARYPWLPVAPDPPEPR